MSESSISKSQGKNISRFVFFIFILLWIFCIIQNPEFNRDRSNYIGLLIWVQQKGLAYSFLILEPFFALLSNFLSALFSDSIYYLSFFSITALFSLGVKLRILKILGYAPFLYVMLFMSYFYFLHEVTQIRIGLGIGLLYLSLLYFISGYTTKFIMFGILSVLCHYSCLVFILFPLLLSKQVSIVFWFRTLCFFILMAVFFLSHGVWLNCFEWIASVADIKKLSDNLFLLQTLELDKFSTLVRLIPHVPLLVFACFYFNAIKKDKFLFVFLQCYLLFFVVVVVFSELYIVAFRLGDLFMFSYILLFSGMYGKVKGKALYVSFLSLFSLVMGMNIIKSVFVF